MSKARYIMIGGFLGAGKTTAILQLARRLREKDLQVGLITNDQSFGLVDTTMLAAQGFPVEEITGGCFCCRFNSLVEAAEKLSSETRPDVFLAEPVGSCTDLKATVSYPLRRIYGDAFSIAPLSVMLDPARALRVLGLEEGKSFSEKVVYIYNKQLEEAEVLVINKCDQISDSRRDRLAAALRERFPRSGVLFTSARDGTGLDDWLERIADVEGGDDPAMEVDYQVYGEGEALLGWVNASVRISGESPWDGNVFLEHLSSAIQQYLDDGETEIAHLKMTLTPAEASNDLAVLNLVRSDTAPEMAFRLAAEVESADLIVNLRAEAAPNLLESAVLRVLQAVAEAHKLGLSIEHIEAFRPGQPKPTYRLAGT